jgi:hypothetical protein
LDVKKHPIIEFKPKYNSSDFNIIAYMNSCSIGNLSEEKGIKINFDILNFLFVGPEQLIENENNLSIIESPQMDFTYKKKVILIRRVENYKRVETLLRSQNGKEITCQLILEMTENENLEQIILLIDHICELMSIARSTLINWTSFNISAEGGKIIYSRLNNAISRNYYGNNLIDKNNYKATKLFLETGLTKIYNLPTTYNFRKLTRAYTETRGGPFLETRTMIIASTIEYLANIVEVESCVTDNSFSKKWGLCKPAIKKILIENFPECDKEKIHDVLTEINRGLKQNSLKERVKSLSTNFGVIISDDEIKNFVSIRNSLAHSGSFPSDDMPVNYYFIMQVMLDRIMLRFFDYHGEYFDINKKEMSVLN